MFVVDEDLDCRSALGEVLEDLGLSPVLFHDPRLALAALARTPPALIVTEIGKPGTPAAAPFLTLLAAAARAALPVVVFSGWNQAAGPQPSFPFIAKPEVAVLLETIRALVRRPPRQADRPTRGRPASAVDAA